MSGEKQVYQQMPSARRVLELGYSCREKPRGEGGGWSVYLGDIQGGEFTYYPGDAGPQCAQSLDDIIRWIGGDQPCYLTRVSEERLAVTVKHEREEVLERMKTGNLNTKGAQQVDVEEMLRELVKAVDSDVYSTARRSEAAQKAREHFVMQEVNVKQVGAYLVALVGRVRDGSRGAVIEKFCAFTDALYYGTPYDLDDEADELGSVANSMRGD